MAKKKKAEATETPEVKTEAAIAEKTETSAEVEVAKASDELVMQAKIKSAPQYIPSTYVCLTNTSQNRISLVGDGVRIDLEPREIKTDVHREDLKQLLKNKVIQNWFDKGILSSNLEADDTSAHEAVAPKNLTEAVERHDNGMNIEASVKKFESAGTVDINLL